MQRWPVLASADFWAACACSYLVALVPSGQSLLSTGRKMTLSLSVPAAVQMFWHPQGDYLAVQVDRYTKTRKSTYTSFEVIYMCGHERVHAASWCHRLSS